MSSSSSSQPTGEMWQAALKALIASNPNLNVSPEIAHALKQPEGSKDAKQELYQQQKMLNLKRKVGQKIERLQNALTRKSLQMQAFQDHIKATLKKELEKFAAEKKSIQEQLVVAQEQLAKLEAGETEIEETMARRRSRRPWNPSWTRRRSLLVCLDYQPRYPLIIRPYIWVTPPFISIRGPTLQMSHRFRFLWHGCTVKSQDWPKHLTVKRKDKLYVFWEKCDQISLSDLAVVAIIRVRV